MSRTARLAAGVGGLMVAGAIAVTIAASGGIESGPAITAQPVAATLSGTTGTTGTTQARADHDGSFRALARALGVDEATLRTALQGARADVRAQRITTKDRTVTRSALVAALAKRLDRPESQVRQAFTTYLAARQSGSREALVTRLDVAVAAGRLSDAERAAVLKAYDAGVLGRGGGAAGRMGHFGPHDPAHAKPTART